MKALARAFMLAAATALAAQTPQNVPLRIHVLEGKTGRPIAGVEVYAISQPSRARPESWTRAGFTDAEGVGTISIPWPTPDHVGILAGPPMDEWSVCSETEFCSSTVLKTGAVGQNLCWSFFHDKDPEPPPPKPSPGNVIIYVHHNGGLSLALHRMLDVPTGIPTGKAPPPRLCPPVTLEDLNPAAPPHLQSRPSAASPPSAPAAPKPRFPAK